MEIKCANQSYGMSDSCLDSGLTTSFGAVTTIENTYYGMSFAFVDDKLRFISNEMG